MAEETRSFDELKAEQEKLWAEAEAHPEPEGYDAWLRQQVEEGLREAADPKTLWYTVDEIEIETEQQINGWRERERKSA